MNPIVHYIKSRLNDNYPEGELSSMIKIILTEVFNFSQIELYCGKDRSFSEIEMKKLDEIISRLLQKEPLQYIIGSEIFHGLTFAVNESTLIPRPETDELVRWIVSSNKSESPSILDIGTGSGCIAISIANDIDDSKVDAWDISERAVETAKCNAKNNGVNVNIKVQDVFDNSLDDYYDNADDNCKYDVIVSNPPYIMESERESMDKNVLDWEPSTALFVPNKEPLLFYKRIAELALKMLKCEGILYFEINRLFGNETKEMLESLGYKEVEIRKDFYDNERMIKAEL